MISAGYRRWLGALGEEVAASFLERRGARLLDRNRRLGRAEIDLLVDISGEISVVEVKSVWATGDSVSEADRGFTAAKAATVRRAARALQPPVFRVDLVTVTFGPSGVDVRWLPRVA